VPTTLAATWISPKQGLRRPPAHGERPLRAMGDAKPSHRSRHAAARDWMVRHGCSLVPVTRLAQRYDRPLTDAPKMTKQSTPRYRLFLSLRTICAPGVCAPPGSSRADNTGRRGRRSPRASRRTKRADRSSTPRPSPLRTADRSSALARSPERQAPPRDGTRSVTLLSRRLADGRATGSVEQIAPPFAGFAWFCGTAMDAQGGLNAAWFQRVSEPDVAERYALVAGRYDADGVAGRPSN